MRSLCAFSASAIDDLVEELIVYFAPLHFTEAKLFDVSTNHGTSCEYFSTP